MNPQDRSQQASRSGPTATGLALSACTLAALGAVVGHLAYGTTKAGVEGAGVALFVAALIAAPIYVQKVDNRAAL